MFLGRHVFKNRGACLPRYSAPAGYPGFRVPVFLGTDPRTPKTRLCQTLENKRFARSLLVFRAYRTQRGGEGRL